VVSAYLIVICDTKTHAILRAEIWSSPEWQQSRVLPNCRTYVAYELKAPSFQIGIDRIIEMVLEPTNRYHYLEDYLRLGRPEESRVCDEHDSI